MFFTDGINKYSLRKRFGVLETIVFILIEIFVFVISLKLILVLVKQNDALMMLPSFTVISIATFFIIGKYRQMEVTSDALKISRWGADELEIKKTDLAGIEINFGFTFRPYFLNFNVWIHSPQRIYYARTKFIYKNGDILDTYKLQNRQVFTLKSRLAELGYPPVTELIRGKAMTDKDRRII